MSAAPLRDGRGVGEARGAPLVPLAALRGVSVLRGQREVLTSVDLEVHGGQCVLLVGPNGCGKSTLVEAMAGALPLGSGEVMHAALGAPQLLRRRQAEGAQVRQRPFGWCLQEDAVCGDARVEERVRDALAVAGAGASAERITELLAAWGLDHRRLDHVAWLSGGLRRRLAVLSALAVAETSEAPRLVLLDEPTEGLDAASQALLAARIEALLTDGHALVIATHDEGLRERATHVVDFGADGTLASVATERQAPERDRDAPPEDTSPLAQFASQPPRVGPILRARLRRLEWRTMASIAPRAAAAAFVLLLLLAVDLDPLESAAGERMAAFLLLVPGLLAAFLPPGSLRWDEEGGAGRWWSTMRGPGWGRDHALHAGLTMLIVGLPVAIIAPWALQVAIPISTGDATLWTLALLPGWTLTAALVARLNLWMVALARRRAVLTGLLAIAALTLPSMLWIDAGAVLMQGGPWMMTWLGGLGALAALVLAVDVLAET